MNHFKTGDKVRILPGASSISNSIYVVLSNKFDNTLNPVKDIYWICNPASLFPEQESRIEVEGRYLTSDDSSITA